VKKLAMLVAVSDPDCTAANRSCFLILTVVFYRAALNAGRSSREKSVRLTVKRVD